MQDEKEFQEFLKMRQMPLYGGNFPDKTPILTLVSTNLNTYHIWSFGGLYLNKEKL